jgi:hypothetical protein
MSNLGTVQCDGSCNASTPADSECPVSCGPATPNISASPGRVQPGQSTTLSWTAGGVDGSCTITGPGVNTTTTAASCSVSSSTITPTISAQSVYSISCDGGETTDYVVVNILPVFVDF